MSASTSTTQLFQAFIGEFYSRRLLLPSPLQLSPTSASPPGPGSNNDTSVTGDNTFDANVVMVLSVLLCALICSLGINSIIRCALRCSSLASSESRNPSSTNKGVKRKALKTFPTVNYSPELKLPGLDTECVICLSEFAAGERVRILPKCNHGFHVRCIDKWLSSHSSCPTCRHCLIETCEKIVGCGSQASPSEPPPPPPLPPPPPPPPPPTTTTTPPMQETIINIPPLEHEGLIRNYK